MKNTKNLIKIDLFKEINNKEIAYILGLLWADGHVTFANNKSKTPIIKHNTKTDDNETFLKILQFSGEWRTFISDNTGSYSKTPKKIATNWISNRELGEFLIQCDYRNKTTSPDKILGLIPIHLKKYWFRGFFDGDGSATIKPKGHRSMAFTSSDKQNWSFIINLFNEINILNYKHRIIESRGGKSSQIRITNKRDLMVFDNYLYDDYDESQMGLYRKRILFKNLY
ncbi:MAG: LAGLIDADG family homing endonuclease [bacterium]